VIGGTGFIGSNLTEALVRAGAEVTAVTPERSRHEPSIRCFEAEGVRVLEADIRDLTAMRTAVEGRSIVFNVAGRSGALQSLQDPRLDLDVNCGGSLALLEAMRLESPESKLVFAGSRLVYGAAPSLPVREDRPVAPLCPHGVHKAAIEQYLGIYGRLYGLRATTLRITNPYGPGQPRGRSAYGVINYLIHRALAGEALPIYGDGAQLRDYVFIGDVVDALLAAGADTRTDHRIYNVGSGVGTSMIEAARMIVDAAGGGRVELRPWPPFVHEIDTGDFVADIGRIGRDIGWRPMVTLADGLRRTIAALTPPLETRR
jgi:nucleoside-diphosphate-sugar epimerase